MGTICPTSGNLMAEGRYLVEMCVAIYDHPNKKKRTGRKLTGRMIRSYFELEALVMLLSATIFILWDPTIPGDFSTDANTTFIFARLKISTRIMISISSDPFAIGIRTCFPCQININVITKQPTLHQKTPEANHKFITLQLICRCMRVWLNLLREIDMINNSIWKWTERSTILRARECATELNFTKSRVYL